MKTSSQSLSAISSSDRERMARMLISQPPVTRERWQQQLKVFEQAGRDTESSLLGLKQLQARRP